VAIESSMMQAGTARSVGHIDVGQARNDVLGTLDGIVGSSDMQRCLPVLVTSIHISLVPQQYLHRLLRRSNNDKYSHSRKYHQHHSSAFF